VSFSYYLLIRIAYCAKDERLKANDRCKFITVAPKVECSDVRQLEAFFQDVIDKGGEGVILRNPSASYQNGRCPGYLKHKVWSIPSLFFLM